MNAPLMVECDIHFHRVGRGWRKELRSGSAPATPTHEQGRVPRVARLMALAIRFDELLRNGTVASYSELAALSHVTRPRISQIMALLNLAPEIQEEVLFLPRVLSGQDSLHLRDLLGVARVPDWRKQISTWKKTGLHSRAAAS